MRTWTLAVVTFGAALGLALAGCGGEETTAPSETVADEQTPTGATTADEAAKKGGILRVGTTLSIPSFNPFTLLTAQQGVALSMTYPQLVQFDFSDEEGYEVVGDFAESWEVSDDAKQITFHTRPDAKWSDGTPMTAEDAAWTINTTVKFQDGPTGQMVPAIEGIASAEAIDDTTLVVNYEHPVADSPLLMASGLFPILPKHIWEPQAEGNGRGLRTFQPERREGGIVTGGPYLVKEYDKTGTTVYVPNPDYYGTPSNAEAVTVTFYTNQAAMLEDLKGGELDWVDTIPPTGAAVIKDDPNLTVGTTSQGLQLELWFNANPRKPVNRELLDPEVKHALAMCIDRNQLIEVIFAGYAAPVANLVGSLGGEFENTDLQPQPFDCEAANAKLDELGYARGSDGIRVVPATTGEYAQPEHRMSYEIITESGSSLNLDRAAELLRTNLEPLGVDLTHKVAGDETATWIYKTGEDCDAQTSTGYEDFDMEVNLTVPEVDPLSTMSGELKESWCVWNHSGYDSPKYDQLYQQALGELDPEKRKELLWEMQQVYYDEIPSIPLVEEQDITAHSNKWTGFVPDQLFAYSKAVYTSPHLAAE